MLIISNVFSNKQKENYEEEN